MSCCTEIIFTATGGTSRDAREREVTKPDGDTGSSGSDKPDCGVYMPACECVCIKTVVTDVFFPYI